MRGGSAKGSLGLTGQVFTVVPYKNDVVSAVSSPFNIYL